MLIEAALLGGASAIGALCIAYGWSGPRRALLSALTGGCVTVVALVARSEPAETPVANRPVAVVEDGYVSSRRCVACHPDNVASWQASYHRTMTQVATTDSVVGAFDGSEQEVDGRSYRLSRRDGRYLVDLPDGSSREVVLTTGSHRMQVYWYEGDGRVLGQLPFVWLIPEARWIPRNAAFLRPPGLSHHSEAGRFNTTCIRCHATHGRLGGPDLEAPETRAAELGIACEACHGPASRHVDAPRNPLARYREHLSTESSTTIVDPETLSAERSSQVCGQCHGISVFHDQQSADAWARDGFRFRPGSDLEAERFPVTTANLSRPIMSSVLSDPFYLEDRFWSDGMVRVSGREYNGLIGSRCYRGGEFSCGSCHEMHPARPDREWANDQLVPEARTNQSCTGCHEDYASDEALTAHTRHEPDSSGSRCQNCHMPYTTYGLLKAIRSHTIDSPSIAASLESGRPNACSLCHLDRSLAWAADALETRDGVSPPPGAPRDVSAGLRWAMEGDAGQRALIAWSMGWAPARAISGESWMIPILGQLLDDPYDAVRFIAARSLSRLEPFTGFSELDYDFVGSRVHRARAKRQVWQWWRDNERGAPNPLVLVGLDGDYDWDAFERLLSSRDDRRVSLQE